MQTRSMFRALMLAALAASPGAVFSFAASAQDAASFAGKSVNVTVGFESGSRIDLYARTLMGNLRRYLPGQPNIIVLNRPGAGGVVALNDWFVKAEPDGLNIAVGAQTQVDGDALARTHARYKPSELRYVGGLAAASQGLFINKAALQPLHEKSGNPGTMGIVGSTLRTGYYQTLWGAAFLGWNVKWVPGYQSTAEVRNALERGEVDMSAFGTSTDIDYLLATGKIGLVSQSGAIIEGKLVPRPAFGNTPVISALVKGKITDPLAQSAFDYSEQVIQVGMFLALPPKTSDAIMAAYVKAFEETVTDAAYQEAWSKIDPDSPVAHKADLEKLMNELAKVSPEALDFIQAELKRQNVSVGAR
jgi:tripartite-type tricarboxylate transporter receptor subunit TctC